MPAATHRRRYDLLGGRSRRLRQPDEAGVGPEGGYETEALGPMTARRARDVT